MSYLVFARKWRPQKFSEVIGQRHVTQTLQNAIISDRVAHAFLFAGSRGIGKTSVARIFAKAINCEQGPAPEPCNECEACKRITNGKSVDVLEIDGASNTGVDDIRELRESAFYLPAQSRKRVYIIDEVHMLSDSAFNALLKILEEPPPHVIFIFATTEPNKIPETVISRCQRFDFRRIPIEEIMDQMKRIISAEGVNISEESLLLLCREAEGSMRDAQVLLDQVISYSGKDVSDSDVMEVLGVVDRKWIYETSRSIIRRDSRGCLDIVEKIYRHGYPIEHFYKRLVEHFRDLIIAKLGGDIKSLLIIPESEIEELCALSNEASLEDFQNWFDMLIKSEEDIRRATSTKIVMEMILVKMANMPSSRSIMEIFKGLKGLEERIDRLYRMFQSYGVEKEKPPFGEDEEKLEGYLPEKPIHKIWKDFIEFSRKKKPFIAAILEHGRPISIKDGRFEISCKNSFCVEKFGEAQFKEQVDSLCEEFFKKKIEISFLFDNVEEGKRELEMGGSIPLTDETKNTEEKIRKDPIVQKALEMLGGKIVDIKIEHGNRGR
jgi:DNA polymerase-3 subunit gamma/tau